jgi:hypothetical protein
MIMDAEDVGHPRVLMTLKRADHTLKRQLRGMRAMEKTLPPQRGPPASLKSKVYGLCGKDSRLRR